MVVPSEENLPHACVGVEGSDSSSGLTAGANGVVAEPVGGGALACPAPAGWAAEGRAEGPDDRVPDVHGPALAPGRASS